VSISSIVSFSPSRNLDNRTACSKEQIARQRHITQAIIESFPLRPYCTSNLKHGLVIRPRTQALRKPYVEFNPPAMASWLVFDIDRDNGAFAWEDDPCVKPPHLAVVNQQNGHAHLWYRLLSPVCRSEAGHLKPLEYLAAIERTYANLLGADQGYAGLVSKNPLHPVHGLIVFRPLTKPYTLQELASNVDLLPKPRKTEIVHGLGRNESCFDTVRQWAYSAIRSYWKPGGLEDWKQAVRLECEKSNAFPIPLPTSEIRSIGESIARWTWKHTTPTGFQESQKSKGKRSGEVRRQTRAEDMERAKELAKQGVSQKVIAETFGVTQSTVSRWLQC